MLTIVSVITAWLAAVLAPPFDLNSHPSPPPTEAVKKVAVKKKVADGGAATPSAAKKYTAKQVVKNVQSFYKKTRHLTAKFRQTYSNKVIDKRSISDGRLWIKKPGKMRWDYKGKRIKVKKSFVSDGSLLWIVEHDNKQVFKKDIKSDLLPVAVTFLFGKGDLSRDFRAQLEKGAKYGTAGDLAVKLTPNKPSAGYKHLILVVDPNNFRVKQSIVKESSGNTNHFRFYEPNTSKPVKDSYFVFNQNAFKHYRIVVPGQK